MANEAPERIWAAKPYRPCVVAFDTPSADYNVEYIRADLTTLSSDAVAGGEPVARYQCSLGVGDGSGGPFVHGDYNSIKAAQAVIFQARDALTELDQLRDRVKELDRALEPFAKAAQDLDETAQDRHDIWEHPVAVSITVAHLRAARRVREGGKG